MKHANLSSKTKVVALSMASFVSLAVVFTGCQVAQVTQLGPQSHFAYPNSNVTPLGPAKAKVSGGSGLQMPMPTSRSDVAVYNKAISQVNGANLVVDYIKTFKVYVFPLLPFFYWSAAEIEGTAAKMEVGKQQLR